MAMSTNPVEDRSSRVERLDADAVCAQCGMVNPEETLICKQCGNNLREQRQRRLEAEQHLAGQGPGFEGRRWLKGIVSLAVLVVLLLTALNVDAIVAYMMRTNVVNPAETFWRGPEAAQYRVLLSELQANIPSPEQKEAVFRNPAVVDSFEGYYVIVTDDGRDGDALLRPAMVGDGNLYDFVALVGPVEIRGRASLRENRLAADWNSAGVRYRGDHIPASGVVIQQSRGGFDGFAQSAATESGIAFKAYQIGAVAPPPEPLAEPNGVVPPEIPAD